MAKLETCANCQRAIGALETPQLFNDHTVCTACYSVLVAQRDSMAIAPSNTAVSSPIDGGSPVQPVQRVGPQVVYVVPRPAPTSEPAPGPVAQSSPVIHVHMPAQVLAQQQPAPPQPAVAQPPIFHHTTQVHVSNNSTATPRVVVRPSSDGCVASLLKLIGAGVVLAVLAVIAAIYFGKLDPKKLPFVPATSKATTGPKSPVRQSPPKSNAGRDSTAAKTTPASQASSSPARSPESASRRALITAAENASLAALHNRPDYVAAKQAADELEAKVKAARADPQKPMLATLSQEWIDAKNNLAKMESEALANDPAVRAAKN